MTVDDVTRTRAHRNKVFWVTCTGTALEYYDFLAYGIAAALVFNTTFFPVADPAVGTLLALATFGTGFLARPLGGLVIGHYGDRIGRRSMLILTLVVMGVATFMIGLLPTYAQIGIWAPISLLVLRLVQGFAAGGEWGGAALFGIESAPPGRRGLYGSFTSMGVGLGGLMAIAVFAVLSAVFPDDLTTWAWRIPFLLGGALVVLGLVARLGLEDTPDFQRAEPDPVATLPIVQVLRERPRAVLLTFGVSAGYNTLSYIAFTFFLSYATGVGYSSTTALMAQVLYAATIFAAAPVAAHLSDRLGRRPVVITGAVLSAGFLFVCFPLIDTGRTALLLLAFAITGPLLAVMQGPMPAMVGEQFDVRSRYSGMSAGYQVGAALGGGLAPAAAAAIYAASDGSAVGVAVYGSAALAVLAVSTFLLKETAFVSVEEPSGTHS